SFSFLRAAAPPALRSFPTRRSSDLLRMTERLSFGRHYAETLERWDRAFLAAADEVRELGFDKTFQRMWHFYLEYSRAGFASGYIDRKSTRLNSSHDQTSYAVFCLKK